MTMRTKLLLYLLGISTLIAIVGAIFYFQLKNMIEPLTPQSIPLSVEYLERAINNNNLINQLIYQQQIVESNLENFIFTNRVSSLENYYMNEAMLFQSLGLLKAINLPLWKVVDIQLKNLELDQKKAIYWMRHKKSASAKNIIIGDKYTNKIEKIKNTLSNNLIDTSSHESAVVTVKLATKNTKNILQSSLRTTLVIFFDAVLISFALALFGSRAISYPIKVLRNDMDLMSRENINAPISKKTLQLKGEVGDLARSFSELIDKLRATTVLKDELLVEVERRKKTEIKLQRVASNLLESNRDLDDFAYAASHDLRSPLRAIENLAKWIQEDCYHLLPEESRKNFDLIKKRTQRLDTLISGMLDYSRAGRMIVDSEMVDVNDLVSEIIDTLSPPGNIKITIDNHMPIIKTNKAALTQVFLNLIGNAIKYNDKALGLINIGSKAAGKYYQFYVADNGQGIEPQFFSKIFEVFQTLQSRDTIESSGIGLAIVNKIVLKLRGKVWLSSVVGEGTVFNFTWPKYLVDEKK